VAGGSRQLLPGRGQEAAQIEDAGQLVGIGQVLKGRIGRVEVAGAFLDPVFQLLIAFAGTDQHGEAEIWSALP